MVFVPQRHFKHSSLVAQDCLLGGNSAILMTAIAIMFCVGTHP
ncbi:MAG: hypothetical protein AAGD25_30100 [Cyanobacteria bacterium P01_F01_bin.150]